MTEKNQELLLSLKNLCKYFEIRNGLFNHKKSYLKAVDNLSLDIYKGEAFGLVGESGCGKTTLGKMIAGLYHPTSGQILFNGTDLAALNRNDRRRFCRDIQMIFQDPYSSLNPRMTVEEIIAEPMIVNHTHDKAEIGPRVEHLLNCVGLASSYKNRYPHEFSGGQRQRIGIARALAVSPKLIICDEAVSALDVSIQAQILNLLMDLQDDRKLTYMFITHDLSVVRHISDEIMVMYLGNVCELAPSKELFAHRLHPYTESLLDSVPRLTIRKDRKDSGDVLQGEVPSAINPPSGCPFHTRCKKCMDICKIEKPKYIEARPNHFVACHLYDHKEGA